MHSPEDIELIFSIYISALGLLDVYDSSYWLLENAYIMGKNYQ